MVNRMKATMTRDESIPLGQASLLVVDAEPLQSVRTECVVIDDFDNLHINDPDLVSEESRKFCLFPTCISQTCISHTEYQSHEFELESRTCSRSLPCILS
mmetsp:Transcript_6328/g.15685  ORF Transcript_6328/g.15685 Transcript_6328/m.15685 type:complete len:100 (+) Transcript_6328:125-424(+)